MAISSQQRALIALMAASARLRRQSTGLLDAEGLSSSQYNVLRILRGAGGPLPTMTIRDRMIDRDPSITRLVDRLVARGFVARVSSTEDRRRVDCHITDDGLAVLDRLADPVDDMDRMLMRDLDEQELTVLTQLLSRVAVES